MSHGRTDKQLRIVRRNSFGAWYTERRECKLQGDTIPVLAHHRPLWSTSPSTLCWEAPGSLCVFQYIACRMLTIKVYGQSIGGAVCLYAASKFSQQVRLLSCYPKGRPLTIDLRRHCRKHLPVALIPCPADRALNTQIHPPVSPHREMGRRQGFTPHSSHDPDLVPLGQTGRAGPARANESAEAIANGRQGPVEGV